MRFFLKNRAQWLCPRQYLADINWLRTAQSAWRSAPMMNVCYAVAGPDIVFENFGGDLVVLDIGTGRYFGFNPTAARVWEALMAGASPGSIAELGFDAAALGGFVEKLADYELIVPVTHSGGPVPDQLQGALAADLSAPTFEVYEDLADLIVADPIHDADDQQGWPRLSKAA